MLPSDLRASIWAGLIAGPGIGFLAATVALAVALANESTSYLREAWPAVLVAVVIGTVLGSLVAGPLSFGGTMLMLKAARTDPQFARPGYWLSSGAALGAIAGALLGYGLGGAWGMAPVAFPFASLGGAGGLWCRWLVASRIRTTREGAFETAG